MPLQCLQTLDTHNSIANTTPNSKHNATRPYNYSYPWDILWILFCHLPLSILHLPSICWIPTAKSPWTPNSSSLLYQQPASLAPRLTLNPLRLPQAETPPYSLHTPNSKNAFPRMSKPPLFKLLHREFTRPPITSHSHQTRRTKEGCSLPNPRIQTGPSSRHQSSTETLRLPS